ncbi:MAG: hypothetical protein ACQESR_07760 [Planctomycetota bacterium]
METDSLCRSVTGRHDRPAGGTNRTKTDDALRTGITSTVGVGKISEQAFNGFSDFWYNPLVRPRDVFFFQ